jgi:2-polyprenyl-6-hydroxyphenyl methylase/3-demethylubiquinone-9 3-methyltransferase
MLTEAMPTTTDARRPDAPPRDASVLTHDRLAERYESVTSAYDLERRLEVLVDEFLAGVDLRGLLALDGGCGPGRAIERLRARGARVVALDLAPRMLALARSRGAARAVAGDVARLPFADDTFDVVLSSEVIEHTPEPLASARELLRVLRPGGHLVLSTPNRLWQPVVRAASLLRLRPFDGLENFPRPAALRRALETAGADVRAHVGVHLWPFQFRPLLGALRAVDRHGRRLLPLMINQCVHALKRDARHP